MQGGQGGDTSRKKAGKKRYLVHFSEFSTNKIQNFKILN